MRVVLAEDLALLRDGLTRLFTANGIEVVAAVDDAPALDPGAGRLDGRPGRGRRAAAAVVHQRRARRGDPAAPGAPGFPVLVLSQYVETVYARELLASGEGSVGYLLKDRVTDVAAFVDDVRAVPAGGTVLDPLVVSSMLLRARRRTPLPRLTEREREVLGLIAKGRSNAAIAARLFVSEKAVGKHTNSIFTKLDLAAAPDDNRRVLAVLAWLEGTHE